MSFFFFNKVKCTYKIKFKVVQSPLFYCFYMGHLESSSMPLFHYVRIVILPSLSISTIPADLK
jgi:hypothetical protein